MGDVVSGIVGGVGDAVTGGLASGITGALFGGGGSGPSPAGQLASGVANVVGGLLSPSDAEKFANQLSQTANPFGQYNAQFGSLLANASTAGLFGSNTGTGMQQQSQFTNQSTIPLNNALNGAQIGQQLMGLINNPSSVFSTPQYQAAFGQGQNAVNATLAAQGLNASGNQLAALQNYGQTFGQNAYNTQLSQLSGLFGQALGANQQTFGQLQSNTGTASQLNQIGFNQLAQLSGLATGSPTAAAAAQAQVLSNASSQAGQSIGQGVGQLASGASGLLNSLGNNFSGNVNPYNFFAGDTTTSTGMEYNSGLYGVGGGIGENSYTTSGGNTWGFTE